MKRRVVVTGLGALTPQGLNLKSSWDGVVAGISGIRPVTRFDVSALPSKIAGSVPATLDGWPDPCPEFEHIVSVREQRRMDLFSLFGIVVADEAVRDAGWADISDAEKERTGVVFGVGFGGLGLVEREVRKVMAGGRVSPLWMPSVLSNMMPAHVALRFGYHGTNYTTTSACASSAHAVGLAYQAIQRGELDVMVAGGAEGALCHIGYAGFTSMRALSSSFNDRPTEASRPWDKARDGFVFSEGGAALVLEEMEHAVARGAHIYAEIKGFGASCDSHHVTAPHPDGKYAALCIQRALQDAGMHADEIHHVNAHGTSTPVGDEGELRGIKKGLGSAAHNIPITSTKSATGHLLGAAGALEVIFAIKGLNDSVVPPTINTEDLCDEAHDVSIVLREAQECKMKNALSNSFGFGGTNTSIIVGQCS
ncbi:MAG: beta-ketoacyl-ACP synthase II [Alphaproteobacteria bacterium]|nr:beta-ketoacyl-ACP synthase II [Alphaproteobacteria bacterium]